MQRITERGKEHYGVQLKPAQDDAFQWTVVLERIEGYDIRNRQWRSVGPVFNTAKAASKWLGFERGLDEKKINANEDALIEEYNALYSDEPQGSHALVSGFEQKSFSKMGRPSQGRERRIQSQVTPELASWIEAQKQDESLSDVIFRLLDGLRQAENQKSL
jgi:hypothetical protein